MAKINGTNVAAAIVPFTTEDQFATHEAKYGKGGWKEVATINERDAISSARREAGMAVRVVSENKTYILKQDLTTWDELVDTSEIEQEIEDIKAVIPAQASAENKLADKNFVNSSVATNTAYFIGTFNSVEELEAYSGTLTNNDYAFVATVDAAGNTLYDRYKYNADTQQWMFEYELNNSSFTADQWAAINSGATTTNIGQIATNTTTISGHITDKNNPHEVTKAQVGLGNVDNTSDLNKPISTATQTALNTKQDTLDDEPLSLYGTNEDGEPEAYKVKPEIVLHNKILPEGYEELDYISNTAAVYNVEEISSSNMNAEITNILLIKSYFETANSQLGIVTKKIKFVYVDDVGSWFSTYAIDENDNEYLLGDRCCTSGSIGQFGVSLTYSVIQVNDYFTVEKNGNDGGQYIDTSVNIKADVYGEYDEEASQQVDNVNVTVNTTSTFVENYGIYTYVDFCAFNDGNSNVFAIYPSGLSYPQSIGSANYLRDTLGIDITGNIVWGTSPTAKDGTNIRILFVKDYDTFAIKTAAKLDGDDLGGVIFGSTSQTGNFGIGLETTNNGTSFMNLAFGPEVTYIPVPNVFVDINAETTTTNYKLIVGENATSHTGTTQKYYTPNTITLFANNNENGITCSLLPTSIKRTTVWKNGEIVFDGVPCREIATGTVGMFDLVAEEFLYSPTETPFVAGNVIEYPYVSTDLINITGDERIDIVKGLDNDEYVQLDYLGSNGTCAIDLGIIPDYMSVFEMKIKNESVPASPQGIRAVYGYWANDISSQTGCGLQTTGYSSAFSFSLCWITGMTSARTESFIGGDTNWHTFKIGQTTYLGEVYVDGTRVWTYNASSTSGRRSIGLFGAFTGMGLVTNFTLTPSFIGKIAYFREYRRNNNYEDIIIHDFVPVKRKSDGELGFYDKITGRFCTNEGSGTFTAGDEYGVKANYIPDTNDSRTLMRNKLQNNTIDSGSIIPANLSNTKWSTVYGNENTIIGSYVSVFGANNTTNGDRSTVLGTSNNQNGGPYSTIVGSNNTTQAGNGTVVGYGNTLTGQNSTVVGVANSISTRNRVARETTVVGAQTYNYETSYSVIIGSNSGVYTSGQNAATIVGYLARGVGYSVVLGYNTQVNSQDGIAIGEGGFIGSNSLYSIAIGYGARVGVDVSSTSSIAIGRSALVQAEDAILLGQGSNAEPHSFYVGFTNGAVKLLDSTFVIPYIRLTTSSPTDGYCLKYDENSDSLIWGEAGSSYTLPIASSSTLGGIKVGSGLSINSSTGVLSANAQALQPATANRLGGIKVGNGLSVENDGTLSADVQSNNFEDIGGDPYDNQALADALNGLQNNLDNVESDLQGQIDNLQSIGRFLAMWDADTGTARYLPSIPFTYAQGDYYIIASVAAQGGTNYMPDGGTYTAPSTVITSDPLEISDMYFYTGSVWVYLPNHARAIAVDRDIDPTSTNPVENRAVAEALDDKQDTLTAGNGIDITDNVISVVNNSVGVPQIANVYTKQINGQKSYQEHAQKAEYLLNYSDIMFNLNLNKDQIIEKMDDLYIGVSRYKHNRNSTKVIGQPHLDVSTDSSQITDLTGNIRAWINYWGYDELSHTFTWTSGDDTWEDEEGNYWSDLGEFGISYTGTPNDGDAIYADFYGMMEVEIRNKIKFNLMNDKYVPLDQKMYCFRFENFNVTSSTTDPRHWQYFYIPEDASSWAYEDWVNNDPSLYMFCGYWSTSNYAKCLNALGSTLVFSDIDDGYAPERYEEGDIDRFVVVGKDNIINDGYASLMRCRAYDDNGNKVYAWCADWNDSGESVYMTQTPTIIPDSYVGTLEDVDTVSSFEADKTFLERRDDLNYWSLQTGNYSVAEFTDYLRDYTFNSVYEWFPQADPERSTTPAWSCYWLDYPIQPVLLRDCEVLTQKTVSDGHRDYERGSWIKLKDLVSKGITDALEDGMPVQFRYPLNTAEMWLRFGAWQKRCLYNDEYTYTDPDTSEEITLYTTPALKNSLADCWKIPDEKLLLTKKAFGRRRGSYNAWNQHTKVSEYIQFNLYTPANITMGTQTSSTAVKTKLTINVCYGDSCLRD